MLSDPDRQVRTEVSGALWSYKPRPVSPPDGIFSDDPHIRTDAVRVWHFLAGDEPILREAERQLLSPDACNRRRFVEAFESLIIPAVLPMLCDRLADPDRGVVVTALRVLRAYVSSRTEAVVEPVMALLERDDEIALAVIDLLGRTHNDDLIPALAARFAAVVSVERRISFLDGLDFMRYRTPVGARLIAAFLDSFGGTLAPEIVRRVSEPTMPSSERHDRLVERIRSMRGVPVSEIVSDIRTLASARPLWPVTIGLFRELIRGDDPDARRTVCDVIRHRQGSQVEVFLPDLIAAVAIDPHHTVVGAIAGAGRAGVGCLVGLLSAEPPGRISMILNCLPSWLPVAQAAAPRLLELFADPATAPPDRAAIALKLLDWGPWAIRLVPDLSALTRYADGTRYTRDLLRLEAAILPHLPALEREVFDRAEPGIPGGFVLALGRLNGHSAVVLPYLRRLLREYGRASLLSRVMPAEGVVEAFGSMGVAARDDLPDLLPFASDYRKSVRRTTCRALGRIGHGFQVVRTLLRCSRDEATGVRREAMRSIGKLRLRDAIAGLTAALQSRYSRTVVAAIGTLAEIGDLPEATLDALENLRTHPHEKIRKRAAEAVHKGRTGSR